MSIAPLLPMMLRPRDIYPPKADHLECKWYCKFLFWQKHPKFIQRREFITMEELNEKGQTQEAYDTEVDKIL